MTGVCVVGRREFETGIGTHSAAALELLGRSLPVALFPVREWGGDPVATLPSGRPVPVVWSTAGFPVIYYADILWNGAWDHSYQRVGDAPFRIAHIAFDSDALPDEWAQIVNTGFDLLMCTTPHLIEVARASGVTIPIGHLPLALDLEGSLAKRYSPPAGDRVRIGAVAAYHERKNLDRLVEAFLTEFGQDEPVELVLHSNLAMGDVWTRVESRIAQLGDDRIRVSLGNLPREEKDALVESFDVYAGVAAGEGYSIGPREALAFGKPLVLSGVPAHRELAAPGVFFVEPTGMAPARYPEIDNRVFGRQHEIPVDGIAAALRAAVDFARTPAAAETATDRKRVASRYSLTALEHEYRRLVDPDAPSGPWAGAGSSSVPAEARELAHAVAGPRGQRVGRRRIVLPARDAGFFSLFNVYTSVLAWSLQESSPPMVLADWDVDRLLKGIPSGVLESYCYSRPGDGNMWLSLFEAPYGLTDADLNDPEFLRDGAERPETEWNEWKEPLLTYSNAYELYRAPWFHRFRKQYASAVREHVRLRPHLQREIDDFVSGFDGRYVVAAHVKHPSHSVEQPDGRIASRHEYVEEVRAALTRKGIREGSDDWGVFLATDQDRVVGLFEEEFGDHLIRFGDVARIDQATDAAFDQLDAAEQHASGHQVQHLLASNRDLWSTRLAWEVWRDAEAMAASDVLIHAVSNVATAVSYLGPDVEMIYCEPVGG
jgi:glycosyltransferase involved in cell wall biosynthesis